MYADEGMAANDSLGLCLGVEEQKDAVILMNELISIVNQPIGGEMLPCSTLVTECYYYCCSTCEWHVRLLAPYLVPANGTFDY